MGVRKSDGRCTLPTTCDMMCCEANGLRYRFFCVGQKAPVAFRLSKGWFGEVCGRRCWSWLLCSEG